MTCSNTQSLPDVKVANLSLNYYKEVLYSQHQSLLPWCLITFRVFFFNSRQNSLTFTSVSIFHVIICPFILAVNATLWKQRLNNWNLKHMSWPGLMLLGRRFILANVNTSNSLLLTEDQRITLPGCEGQSWIYYYPGQWSRLLIDLICPSCHNFICDISQVL